MKYLLGIDVGTQSIRVCLFDEKENNICSKTTEQYVRIDHPSWASQDAGAWWEAVVPVSYTHLDVYKRQR